MAFSDLRQYLDRLESTGELKRIKKEVDWNLELSHVAKINEESGGGQALLFENVKDYPGKPVLASLLASHRRVALALDMPLESKSLGIAREWVARTTAKKIAPRVVSSGPCKENIVKGDKVNLLDFPAPWFYPKDGGRYIGTAAYLISRSLDNGRLNLGTYRSMIYDERRAGVQLIKAKDAEIDLRGYAARREPMPVALVIGGDPVLFLCSSTLFPLHESEYDAAGALRGEPVDVVKAETSDLLVPANAEIVIEGEIMPGELLDEGPFGEYTGYYSGKGRVPREFIKVSCITHRTNPILWATSVGKPITDTHVIQSINRAAALWEGLEGVKIPGIQGVYCPPAAGGRFMAIISVKQMYHGHATHAGLAAFSTVMGNYGLKTVIVVDEDIDPENIDQVIYAVGLRYQPERGTQILTRGRSTPLDPSLEIANRDMTSRILIDATIPYEWKEKPIPIELDGEVAKRVRAQWNQYFE